MEILQDISELKDAEQELLKISNLLLNIIDPIPSALVTVDSDMKVETYSYVSSDSIQYSDIMVYPLVTGGIEGAVI